jgi:uncharacterized protein (DUF58 family)
MLPSPRLIIMVLAAAPIFMAGILYEPFSALGVLYVFVLAAYMTLDALLLPRAGRIGVERALSERLSIGAPMRVILTVSNRTRRRVEIRLAEDVPATMTAEPEQCVGRLDARGRTTLSYRLTATRRGRYELGAVDVRVLPTMGLFYRQFRVHLPQEVHVFPNLVNISRYELLVRRGMTHEQGLARLRQIGQGNEFESLRPYSWGEEMSRVDWKATAKRSRLIVRNFEAERRQRVLLALDVGRATAGEFEGMSRLDYFINAALMLAYVALRQGDWVSLLAFSDRIESYLPPVRHARSVERVARVLYGLESRLTESDYDGACRFLGLKQRTRSFVCMMTDVLDREASRVIIQYMARFARHHLPLAVTLSDPELRAVAWERLSTCEDAYSKAAALDVMAAREEALLAMRRRGVGVLDVEPRQLTPELVNRYLLIKSTRRL